MADADPVPSSSTSTAPRPERASITVPAVSNQAQDSLSPQRSPIKQLEFLTELARDFPDHYVCEQCLELHTVDDETEGFAADVAFVENASHEKKAPKKRHLGLDLPCQRKNGIRFSASGSSHPVVHNFTGDLSSARRTPLAGILHRDVELTLKRARLLKDMQDKENEDQLADALDAAVFSDSSDNGSDKMAFHTPSCKSTQPVTVDDTVATVQEVSSDDEDIAEQGITAEESDEEETVVVHASTNEAAAELAEAGPSTDWARKSEAATTDATPPKFRKNGWMAMFTDTVASTATSLIPQSLRFETAEDKEQQAQKTREQEPKDRRQHLETALAAALKPITAYVSLVKIDRISRSRYPFRETTTAKYTFAPSIKENHYMLKTTVKIHRQEAKNVAISICPHQLLKHHGASDAGPDLRLQQAVGKVNDAMRQHTPNFRALYEMGAGDADELDENEYESDNDVPDADKDCKQGMRQRGSCHRCATDFAVRGLSRKNQIMISVWQDLGEETCMADAHWQSHIPGEMLQIEDGVGLGQTTNLWDQGLEVLHLAGGVRAMYEGTPITLAPFTYKE